MKYGVLTNFLHDWALLEIYKTNKVKDRAIGKVIATSKESPWHIGECCDYWALKQIKFVSKKQAEEIKKHNHYQFPKLTVDFDGTLFLVRIIQA